MKKTEKEKQDQVSETELNAEAAKPEAQAEEQKPETQGEAQKPEPEKQPESAQESSAPQKAEEADGKPAEKPASGEGDKAEETSAAEDSAPKPVEANENEQLRKDLLSARSQLAAYAAGIVPEMVADAVTLAIAEAQTAGEVTEEAVTKAMAGVLKRHPEWKAADGKRTGGFKLGADPDASGRTKTSKNEDGGNKKRWNRFK